MSSTLQNEKTKWDAKALGNDLKQHGHDAIQSIKDGAHKLGVATGLSEPTTGEKIGSTVENAVDTLTGEKRTATTGTSTDSGSTISSSKGICTCKSGAGCSTSGCDCNSCHSRI